MSEPPTHQVAALGETTSTKPTTSPARVSFSLPPRRMSSGSLVAPEKQLWPNHPKNKRFGSVNSGIDAGGENYPISEDEEEGEYEPELTVRDILENAATLGTGPPDLPTPTTPRYALNTSPGSGKNGLPTDGSAWKNFMGNQKHIGTTHDHTGVNIPNSTEAFQLGKDEKKIEEKIDTRTPNTTIFTFNKEDHTLANLLREKLLTNSHVTFAAYRIPHPLFATFELRVQTDGEITPKEAVLAASRDLVGDLSNLKTNFTREYELRKMVGGAQNGQ